MMTWSSLFFSNPSSNLMESIILMNDYAMMFIFSILVMAMMIITFTSVQKYISLNFYEHHSLESIWTVTPFIMLIFLVIPSLDTLYSLDSCLFCGLSVSIMGHQWYWSYFYKDFSQSFMDSYMIPSSDSSVRLLEADNRLIVPVSTPVRLMISSSDVIHSWTVPSLGIKMDAIPGRINQICFSSYRTGIFFGQCSEICGANHSFMPIVMESVLMKDFLSSM